MSEWGVKTGEACSERIFSPDVPKGADIIGAFRHFRVVPKAAVSNRSKADNLFDHPVGAGEQRQRHHDAQCLCSFAVYHLELSLGAADHRATEFV
jgi:hypothetical protein